jgi:hypothetical protein
LQCPWKRITGLLFWVCSWSSSICARADWLRIMYGKKAAGVYVISSSFQDGQVLHIITCDHMFIWSTVRIAGWVLFKARRAQPKQESGPAVGTRTADPSEGSYKQRKPYPFQVSKIRCPGCARTENLWERFHGLCRALAPILHSSQLTRSLWSQPWMCSL